MATDGFALNERAAAQLAVRVGDTLIVRVEKPGRFSRDAPLSGEENAIVSRARQLLAAYEDMAEMIRLGAYRPGSDARTDEAIRYYPALEAFLTQGKRESSTLQQGYRQLADILASGGVQS